MSGEAKAPTPVDFTAYRNPLLAVPCNDCRQPVGSKCIRPSGHSAAQFHKVRGELADAVFIELHGEDASIEQIEGVWIIDPAGAKRRQARNKTKKKGSSA